MFILHLCFIYFLFLGPLFPDLSFLLWNSLWLVEMFTVIHIAFVFYLFFVSWSFVPCFVFPSLEFSWLVEVLTSLCLFLVMRMEISQFL